MGTLSSLSPAIYYLSYVSRSGNHQPAAPLPHSALPQARPRCLTRGQIALVEVTSSRALVLEQYSEYQALGRVALREGGRTLAVGIVTRLLE